MDTKDNKDFQANLMD
ncbi:Protein of unknown function [Escherichia coli D6-113.11]|nr:Protein of unknown function [Escherichia coli D6-113.11]CDU36567.1 Protein of unknown function [Escherichia coli D6-113.11]